MDGLGDWNRVPDDEFRLILDYLSFQEIGNFRCVSKGMKRRITWLLKSKFNKFSIPGIYRRNCNKISETLFLALAEPYAPKWLELNICFKLNPRMRQILQVSSEALTSLVISIKGNEEFLLHPGMWFKNLESLEINDYNEDGVKCYDENYYDTKATVVEAMLVKHASNLKKLTVKDLEKSITVPALPKLENLALMMVGEEPGANLIDQTRHTIISLEIDKLIINGDSTTPFTEVDSTNDTFYEIQNLNHLKIESLDCKFILCNAEHLMSLVVNKFHYMGVVRDIEEDIFQDIHNVDWPQLTNLRELGITASSDLLPILRESIKTLELLVIKGFCHENEYVVMPKLTDLYVIDGRDVIEFTNEIYKSNNERLEYLFLKDSKIPALDDGIRMERMKLVVLRSDNDPYYNYEYSDQDRDVMAVICPNADVILCNKENEGEIMKQVKLRCKRRNFSIDITRMMESDYWFSFDW